MKKLYIIEANQNVNTHLICCVLFALIGSCEL